MSNSISFAGEGQIIVMIKERGWEYQARRDPAKHQEITFRSHLPTLLYNGGEEKQCVTFHYDRDLYFRKSGVALFISPPMGKVAFYTGWPDSTGEVKEAKVYRLDEFWERFDDLAGYVTHGSMTPARPPPDSAEIWKAVCATSEATNQHQGSAPDEGKGARGSCAAPFSRPATRPDGTSCCGSDAGNRITYCGHWRMLASPCFKVSATIAGSTVRFI